MVTKSKGSRKIARYSLLFMGLGFLATAPFRGSMWMDLLHGGFEAGLVGGLADWFAVTALFRHPLGIPIPHTALLPNNRQRVTNALVKTLKRDWLSKESIQEKVKYIPFTEKLITFVENELKRETLQKAILKLIKKMINKVDIEKLTPFVKKQLISSLSNIEMKKIISYISNKMLTEEFNKKTLDHFLKKVEAWLNKEQTVQKLGLVSMNVINKFEADGFLQFALKSLQNFLNEEKLGNIVQSLLLNVVKNLKNEGDPNREALILFINKELQDLNDNENFLAAVEKWKQQLLNDWEPDQTITDSLKQIQQKALELVEDEKFFDTYMIPFIDHVKNMLQEGSPQIDEWVQKQIIQLVENNHDVIGDLVQENLNKLDNETLVDMIENNIGKDLQWIRVNGAVCGFVIGLILTGAKMLSTIWA